MEHTLIAGSLSNCGVDHCFVDSTSKGLDKAEGPVENSLATAKTSRGMFVKACVAKAMTWELESVKALPTHDSTTNEASSS